MKIRMRVKDLIQVLERCPPEASVKLVVAHWDKQISDSRRKRNDYEEPLETVLSRGGEKPPRGSKMKYTEILLVGQEAPILRARREALRTQEV